jgi:tetratricopeptide (TPR) repeat protein
MDFLHARTRADVASSIGLRLSVSFPHIMSGFIELGLQGNEMAEGRHFNLRFYLRQQPVMLVLLSVLLVLFFLFVTGLSSVYHAQRQALGNRWFSRGVADLNAKNYAAAVTEFRTALLYSRDDYSYQLNLAEALIGVKHTGEASAYLLNLWDREPEDGLVNLELARIAAQQRQTKEAVRYYHDAVYAAWPSGQQWKRRDARFELIELLLRIGDKAQAQAELIALAENVDDDPTQQEHIGDLFLRAQDYEHALAAYRVSLRSDPRNQAALAGAGYAAFELGRYPLAQHYLEAAVTSDPQDAQSAERLNMTEMVLNMDPFRRQISAAERSRIVMDDFAAAGHRIKTCAIPKTAAPRGIASQAGLTDEWAKLRPKITDAGLRGNPDLGDAAMDLVFRIERQTSILCGPPTGPDMALFLIAKSQGN